MGFVRHIGHNVKIRLVFPIIDYLRNQKIEKLIAEKDASCAIEKNERDEHIVLSMTTVPSRVHIIQKSLESICRQSVKPDVIRINLGVELFGDVPLPDFIQWYENKGVSVRYVEDIGPHTKYYHVMKEFPHSLIITFDDDIIYDFDMVENLLKLHKRHPDAVCANRAHVIRFDSDGKILPYNKWIDAGFLGNKPSDLYLATGVGGVLYPPDCMDSDLLDKDIIRMLSFKADDIWLKWMQIKKGTKVVTRRPLIRHLSEADGSQKEALSVDNVVNLRNDEYIKNIKEYYSLDDNIFAGSLKSKKYIDDWC